jgi:hypothetical protein
MENKDVFGSSVEDVKMNEQETVQKEPISEEAIEAPEENDTALEDVSTDVEDVEFGDVSDSVLKSVELLPEDTEEVDGKKVSKGWYKIEDVEWAKPYLKEADGTPIPPTKFNPTNPKSKEGYKTKAKITYKDSNYVSNLPSIKWFKNVQDGKTFYNPSFRTDLTKKSLNDNFVAEIEKLYVRYCQKIGVRIGSVSKKQFQDDLKNYEVRLSQYYDTRTEPHKPVRLDIFDFRKVE